MQKDLTEMVFILDRSGSMTGLEDDTIGGYNSLLEKQKINPGSCIVTTVLFDHCYELLHDRIDIRAVQPITEKEYYVRGQTALLDAIGMTIHKIANAQRNTAEDFKADKVIFVIITDGKENSSREYSVEQVKEMIERQKNDNGWEFIFLGANIDAVKTAGAIGISADRAVDYVPDSEGTRFNYDMMSDTVTVFRESGIVPEAPMAAIRKDMKKRGKRK